MEYGSNNSHYYVSVTVLNTLYISLMSSSQQPFEVGSSIVLLLKKSLGNLPKVTQ